MKNTYLKKIYCAILIVTIMLSLQNCKSDIEKIKKGSWSPNVVVPMIDTRISVNDLLLESDTTSIIKTDSSGQLVLIYRGTVFSTKGQKLITIRDTTLSENTTLPEISFPDFTIQDSVSLGLVVINIPDQTLADSILSAIGQINYPLPPIPPQSAGIYSFPSNSQFGYVTFSTGTVTLSVKNNFPITIAALTIRLINNAGSSPSDFAIFNFTNISPGNTQQSSADVSNKTFSNNMSVSIDNFQSSAGFVSNLDTATKLILTADFKNISVSGGQGVIPAGSQAGRDTMPMNTGSNDQLTKLKFKSGFFTSTMSSPVLDSLDITLTFLNIISPTGNPLVQTYAIGIPANSIDLTDYTVNFVNGGGVNNGFVAEYIVQSNGNQVTYSAGDPLNLNISLDSIQFDYLEGILGYHSFKLPSKSPFIDTIPIDIYRNYKGGNIHFVNPKVSVLVTNFYGFEANIKFDVLEYEDRDDYSITPLAGPGTNGDSITIIAPTVKGSSALTNYTMDPTSVSNMIAAPPVNIYYGMTAASSSGKNGFILDTSYFQVDVDVELPFNGYIDSLVIVDTFKLDVPSIDDFEYANFKLYTENGFPLDVNMQLYFYDDSLDFSSSHLLDSLIPNNQKLLKAGKDNNSDGRVDVPTANDFWIPYTSERFKKMKKTQKILLKAMINSLPYQQNVKFYSDYYLNVKLGIQSNLKLN